MKLLEFLLKPVSMSKKTSVVCGVIALVLFAASSITLTLIFDLPIAVVCALIAVCSYAFFRMKLHTMVFSQAVIMYVIGFAVSAYFAYSFYIYDSGSQVKKIISSVCCGFTVAFPLFIVMAFLFKVLSDGSHPKNFLKALAAFAPLFFSFMVYLPSETYFNNHKDFKFIFMDFAPYIFTKAIICTLLASLVVCVLRQSLFRFVTAAAAGLSLCIYCQAVFMNSVLPVDMGESVEWDSMRTKMVINLIIWAVILVVTIAYSVIIPRVKTAQKNAMILNAHLLLNAFIGAVQFVTLAVLMFTTPRSLFSHERYLLDNKEQFTVSSKNNIITIIVDSADRHFFDDACEKYPERFEFLKDFTYYTNACMMYDSTYLSIPQMLSGTSEFPEKTFKNWLKKAWSSEKCESFYERLHQSDYKVNVYGDFCFDYEPLEGKIDNCVFSQDESTVLNKTGILDDLADLSAYRYMPVAFKKNYEDSPRRLTRNGQLTCECAYTNEDFLSKLTLEKSDSDKNYFIVEHIRGTHRFSGYPADTVITSLDVLENYCKQLKQLGVYDDATIIITADHGKHDSPDNLPIWYIKTPGEHNDKMKNSNAPIYHTDYLATCIKAGGLEKPGDEELFGRSIFSIGEDEKRTRLVFQRYTFQYVGTVKWDKLSDENHDNALLGYYFTGTREDLAKHEATAPPDVVIEFGEDF